jgi:hypothetical protein
MNAPWISGERPQQQAVPRAREQASQQHQAPNFIRVHAPRKHAAPQRDKGTSDPNDHSQRLPPRESFHAKRHSGDAHGDGGECGHDGTDVWRRSAHSEKEKVPLCV